MKSHLLWLNFILLFGGGRYSDKLGLIILNPYAFLDKMTKLGLLLLAGVAVGHPYGVYNNPNQFPGAPHGGLGYNQDGGYGYGAPAVQQQPGYFGAGFNPSQPGQFSPYNPIQAGQPSPYNPIQAGQPSPYNQFSGNQGGPNFFKQGGYFRKKNI